MQELRGKICMLTKKPERAFRDVVGVATFIEKMNENQVIGARFHPEIIECSRIQ